jgi:hypothetical protein
MAAYQKTKLSLPFNSSNIAVGNPSNATVLDVGTHYNIGQYVYNRNLTLTSNTYTSTTTPMSTAIGWWFSTTFNVLFTTTGYCYYNSKPLMLNGNNCCLDPGVDWAAMYNTGTGIGNINTYSGAWKPSSWQTYMLDTVQHNFTSTSGITTGQTFVTDANSLYIKNIDGSLTWLCRPSWNSGSTITMTYPFLIGENANFFYFITNYSGLSYCNNTTITITSAYAQLLYNTQIVKVSKSDWSTAILISGAGSNAVAATASGLYAFSAFKVMGLTSDNKVIITCYPAFPNNGYNNTTHAVGGYIGYLTLNLTTNTLTPTVTKYQFATQNTVSTCMVPSSWSTDPVTTTSNKYYIPVCDATNTTATTIKRVLVPQTWGSKTDPVVGDFTACTLTGIVGSIPNPNSTPANPYYKATSSCFYLNQKTVNSTEYCVVINMGYANINSTTSGYGGSALVNNSSFANGCDVARHCLFVFKIDPTNSANLIYKSSLNDGTAFGTNAVLYNINASADKTIFVLSNLNQFVILYWNSSTESYDNSSVYTISNGIGKISLDTSNQLWIQEQTTNSVYVYHLNNSQNVVVSFQNNPSTVGYSGSNLSQNVVVNSYTLAGARQVKSVTLTVTGPATFTSNSSTTLTVSTSSSVDTLVALTITGTGQVTISPTNVA